MVIASSHIPHPTPQHLPFPALVRMCCITGQELKPGERIYGVLYDEAGKFVRKDYSEGAWSGPGPGAIAHWAGRIPSALTPRKPTFNDKLLLDCFDHLAGATEPNRLQFRYVVALLLMRRKKLKFEDAPRKPDGSGTLILRDGRTGRRIEIDDPKLTEEQVAAVQDEVFQVLGWE